MRQTRGIVLPLLGMREGGGEETNQPTLLCPTEINTGTEESLVDTHKSGIIIFQNVVDLFVAKLLNLRGKPMPKD